MSCSFPHRAVPCRCVWSISELHQPLCCWELCSQATGEAYVVCCSLPTFHWAVRPVNPRKVGAHSEIRNSKIHKATHTERICLASSCCPHSTTPSGREPRQLPCSADLSKAGVASHVTWRPLGRAPDSTLPHQELRAGGLSSPSSQYPDSLLSRAQHSALQGTGIGSLFAAAQCSPMVPCYSGATCLGSAP